jgi:MFS family permease
MIPTGAIAGILLTKMGRYKPLHWLGFALLAISFGLFSIMTSTTSTAAWACFQLLAGVGIGFPLTTQLPAIQAVLPESDTAISTSTYSFIRSFGFIWGATIPSIVFNSRVNNLLGSIDDPGIQAAIIDGGAYSYALHISDLQGMNRTKTLHVYHEALRVVWLVGVAFALCGFVLVFFEKHVEMRTTLEMSFGLEKEDEKEKAVGLREDAIRKG